MLASDFPWEPLDRDAVSPRRLRYLLPWFLDRTNCDPGLGIDAVEIGGRRSQIRTVAQWETPFARLLRFRPDGPPGGPPLLVVAPMSGHFAALLRDMLVGLIPRHDLHLLAWRDARDIPLAAGDFGLDDQVAHILDAVRGLGGAPHLLGICQSALPALAATALLAAGGETAPKSLTLFGGVLDARISPTRVARLAAARSLDWMEDALIEPVPPPYGGRGRRVYPAALQQTALLAYLTRHLASGGELLEKVLRDDGDCALAHPFLKSFLSIMDLPARLFLDMARVTFKDFALPLGALSWRGRPVDPAAISGTGLFTVEGERDDVSSPGQTRIAHALCPNIPAGRRRHHLQPDAGHFKLFHGQVWRSRILPRLATFIREME